MAKKVKKPATHYAKSGAFSNPFPPVSAGSRIAGGGERVTEDSPGYDSRTQGNKRRGRRHYS